MKFNEITIILALVVLNACATAHPEKVPDLDCAPIPTLETGNYEIKAMTLTVKNERPINQTFKNADAVSDKVKEALICAANKGSVKVGSGRNHWIVTLQDCEKREAKDGGECTAI